MGGSGAAMSPKYSGGMKTTGASDFLSPSTTTGGGDAVQCGRILAEGPRHGSRGRGPSLWRKVNTGGCWSRTSPPCQAMRSTQSGVLPSVLRCPRLPGTMSNTSSVGIDLGIKRSSNGNGPRSNPAAACASSPPGTRPGPIGRARYGYNNAWADTTALPNALKQAQRTVKAAACHGRTSSSFLDGDKPIVGQHSGAEPNLPARRWQANAIATQVPHHKWRAHRHHGGPRVRHRPRLSRTGHRWIPHRHCRQADPGQRA